MSNRQRILALLLAFALLSLFPVWARAQGEPISDDPFADALTLPWDDGDYLVEVSLEGGSGRANVTSPALVNVEGSKAVAHVEWSSPNYDYMVVAGKTYLPVNDEGNSVFVIPMLAVNEPFDVIADTTAMSQPHEISYRLTFESSSAITTSTHESNVMLAALAGGIACLVLIALFQVGRKGRPPLQ